MTIPPTAMRTICLLLLLPLAVLLLPGAALAACGGKNQEACPWYEKGPKCRGNLTEYKDICRAWGQRNQQPWPASRIGFQCDKGLAPKNNRCEPCGNADGAPPCEFGRIPSGCANGYIPDGNVCRACGRPGQRACAPIEGGYPCFDDYEPNSQGICTRCGENGAKACRVFKDGEECGPWLDKDSSGICRPCGGDGQEKCPVIKADTVCKPGLGTFGGVCRECGQEDKLACPAIEVGRQCEEWTTNRDGYCRACGDQLTGACRLTDKGKPCKPGYKLNISGGCEPSDEMIAQRKAEAQLKDMDPEILVSALRSAKALNDNPDMQDTAHSGASSPTAYAGANPDYCFGDFLNIQTWTMGVSASADLIVGVEGETGMAFRCGGAPPQNSNSDPDDDVTYPKVYSAGTLNVGTGTSAGGEFVLGYWTVPFNGLRGKSHGASLDFLSVLGTLGKLGVIDEIPGLDKFSLVLTLWWERLDEDGDGDEDEWGEFQGFTVGLGGDVSLKYEKLSIDNPLPQVEYLQASTQQVCDYGMGCGEHEWREVYPKSLWSSKDNGVSTYRSDSTYDVAVEVVSRNDEKLVVNITQDGTTRPRLEFVRDTELDSRDYRLMRGSTVLERLCYRNTNFKLMYRQEDRNCDGGIRLVRDKFRPGGLRVDVKSRNKDEIEVDITKNGETRRGLVFERATMTDKRDYLRREGEDDVIAERLCFRSNFHELMYRSNTGREDRNAGDCDFGLQLDPWDGADEPSAMARGGPQSGAGTTRSRTGVPEGPATPARVDGGGGSGRSDGGAQSVGGVDAMGDWLMDVGGRDLTRSIVRQTDAYIMVVQPPRDGVTRFDRVGPDEYRAASGESFRFVSGERGLWVSADRGTVYQMRRR